MSAALYAGGEIWAIDPATKTGFACGEPGSVPKLSTHDFGDGEGGHTALFGRATFFLADRLRTIRPGLIVIEAPVPPRQVEGGSNYNASEISLGLNGIFCGIAHCKGIPLIPAHIGSWRKYFLGRGNLKGKEAKLQAMKLCAQLGWKAPDDNAAEAAGMWSWACGQVAPQRAIRVEPLFAHGALK